MITLRETGIYIVQLVVPGVQAASATAAAVSEPLPFDGFIKAIFAKLDVAGVTSSQLTDLFKNAASVMASSVLFTFATGVLTCTYGDATLSANPTAVSKGDILSLVTSQVHTTPAKGLAIGVVIQRTRATGGPPAKMQTDTYGVDSDTV